MAESFIDDEIAIQLARNEELLQLIDEHGAARDERRSIDFFFYAGDLSAAGALAADLEAAGFETHVGEEPRDGKWLVQGVRQDTVTAVTEPQFVERVVRLAARHLAEFDGWGTAI